MSSEVGVLEVPEADILSKGIVRPGQIFFVDFNSKKLITDKDVKNHLAWRQPYSQWLNNIIRLPSSKCFRPLQKIQPQSRTVKLAERTKLNLMGLDDDLLARLKTFGYTVDALQVVVGPMVLQGADPLGSMGNDVALAALSKSPRNIFDYFHQLFAQVAWRY